VTAHEPGRLDAWIDAHLDDSLAELGRLVGQPSVAAQNLGMEECAALVASMLKARRFDVDIVASGGPPVVYAERDGRGDRTLLFYNHYDVQPAEPLELWESPPFTATRRDGKVYGRGISDDKGHITSRLLAIDALDAVEGGLPCRVKFVIEGEEEVSSVHLHDFVVKHKNRLAADACVWEFGGVDHLDVPQQYCGLRGICYVELSVETASIDAHSGIGGSIFPNAAWRLTWALASLKGPDERIQIPGFYDKVVPPTARDVELFAALPDAAEEYRTRYGIRSFLRGVQGGSALRVQETLEPTCTICGLTSGYQGPGSKTVLPARASAKVDFRLVPDQHPDQVVEQLRKHLDSRGFGDVRIERLGGEPPARTDPDDPFVRLVCETAEPVYGRPMQLVPMIGGSGPNHAFVHELGLPVATAGCGHPDTRAHAPNENIRIDLYALHAKHMARLLTAFAGARETPGVHAGGGRRP
jgi:acetylornithine deacetylase/succinyl-diaminopimelate desuccinylase-like protein